MCNCSISPYFNYGNFKLSTLMGCIRMPIVIIRNSLPPLLTLCVHLWWLPFRSIKFPCMRVPWDENQTQPIMAIKDVYFGARRYLWLYFCSTTGRLRREYESLSCYAIIYKSIGTDRRTGNARLKCYHMFSSYLFLLEAKGSLAFCQSKNTLFYDLLKL